MKPAGIFLCFASVAFAAPVSSIQDQNATIWAQSAVTAMKASIEAIYDANVDLYNRRTIFNQPHLPCQAPPASGESNDTVCTQADQLAGPPEDLVTEAWRNIAEAMFPTFYGLPDNAHEPRATFSDFSHFFDYLFLETKYLANITTYYACNANLRYKSLTWQGMETAYFANNDLANIFFGPTDPTTHFEWKNGTQNAYGFDTGRFYYSWNYVYLDMADTYDYLQDVITVPKNKISIQKCMHFIDYGLRPPIPPAKLPTKKPT